MWCWSCDTEKAETEFYPGKGRCKDCIRTLRAQHHAINRDARLASMKRYDATPAARSARERYAAENPDVIAAIRQRSRARSPEKIRAREAVNNAVRDGRLVKQPCQKCGELRVQAHHTDYSKPLDVVWLCTAHHHEEHAA